MVDLGTSNVSILNTLICDHLSPNADVCNRFVRSFQVVPCRVPVIDGARHEAHSIVPIPNDVDVAVQFRHPEMLQSRRMNENYERPCIIQANKSIRR